MLGAVRGGDEAVEAAEMKEPAHASNATVVGLKEDDMSGRQQLVQAEQTGGALEEPP